MRELRRLAKNAIKKQYEAEDAITLLERECQKYVNFGEVHVDYLPGDGLGVTVDSEQTNDTIHVAIGVFTRRAEAGIEMDADFFNKYSTL